MSALSPAEVTGLDPATLEGSTRALQPQHTCGVCMGRGGSPSRNWNALQNALLLIFSAL